MPEEFAGGHGNLTPFSMLLALAGR